MALLVKALPIPSHANAAGTQFAHYAAGPARAGLRPGRKMAAKLFILAIGALATIPAAASMFWPREGEDVMRAVELNGPFSEFNQTRDRIQLRLAPAHTEREKRDRTSILVRDGEGDELAIPLKRGQTWASAELPPALASADELEISLQQ